MFCSKIVGSLSSVYTDNIACHRCGISDDDDFPLRDVLRSFAGPGFFSALMVLVCVFGGCASEVLGEPHAAYTRYLSTLLLIINAQEDITTIWSLSRP